jgi:hypothetical protein
MRLILHILGKDVRRLWAPIVALLAIEATAAFDEIYKHLSDWPILPQSVSQSTLLLLPFAWIFLIAALILQERLPGTRQYWLTRPIGWPTLLAAKLLFVVVFINAVLFVSDCAILFFLHLPIHPSDLLLRQIPLTVLLFLPAFCLASISSGLGQIAVGLIVTVLGFILELLIPTLLQRPVGAKYAVSFMAPEHFSYWQWTTLPALTLLIIIFQFARRATFLARFLFAIPLFGLIPVAVLAVLGEGFLPKPRLAEGKPDPNFSVSFDFASGRRPVPDPVVYFTGLQLPIQIQGLSPDAYVSGSGSVDLSGQINWAGAFLYNDHAGQWLRLSHANDRAQIPHEPVQISASIDIATFKVERTQEVLINSKNTFSPAAGVFCRSVFPETPQFRCWGGPQQRQAVPFRAFEIVDETPIGLHDERPNLFYENGMPWTFSPIVDCFITAPRNLPAKTIHTPKPDTQVQFLTLGQTGTLTRTLQAEKIDLSQYLVKP